MNRTSWHTHCVICGYDFGGKIHKATCSDECAKQQLDNIKFKNKIKSKLDRSKLRAKFVPRTLHIEPVKHDNLVPICKLDISENRKTLVKQRLREFKLTDSMFLRKKRVDGMTSLYNVIAARPSKLKTIVEFYYERYKEANNLNRLNAAIEYNKVYKLINNYED